ncbi:MAG: AraC family transcriptional regulator [Candidatus Methylacidiphilales bacterium]|nr:AraC family transcriptional regulator [Candidatus Methylacidiphilales bacterium]
MIILTAREILRGEVKQQHAMRLRGVGAFPFHRHDFAEVFWVSRGRGVHRLAIGSQDLEPGFLGFIRAADAHGYESEGDGFLLHNIAFDPQWLESFRRRHYPGKDWPWSGRGGRPVHRHLSRMQIERLALEFAALARSTGKPRDAERFLLNLLHVAAMDEPDRWRLQDRAPVWLGRALQEWEDPRHWSGGTRALARLAGRSEEHVARVVRRWVGCSPTDLLNRHRMQHAAHLLAATDRKVLDIALECGCASLGHFYTIFHRHHGCAPGSYRKLQPPRPI